MSVTDPLLKTLKLQILELHHSFQFLSPTVSNAGDGAESTVEGCSSSSSGGGSGSGGASRGSTNDAAHYEPITDAHPYLTPLCRTLEEICRKGLLPSTSSLLSLSPKKDNYWRWIEALPGSGRKIPPMLRAAIEATRKDERVLTYVGRGQFGRDRITIHLPVGVLRGVVEMEKILLG